MSNNKISVAMIVRTNLNKNSGGDTTQIKMTAKYLKFLGVDVDIFFADQQFEQDKYTIIHFFNIIRPYDILPYLKYKTKKYVVSTIFVDYSLFEKHSQNSFWRKIIFRSLSLGQIEYVKAWGRWVFNGEKIKSKYYLLFGHKSSIKRICSSVDLLLPNSDSEAERLKKYLGKNFQYRKIVNAVDISLFNRDVKPHKKYENYVICVGRIEPLKNQYNLIKAILQTPYKLAIIGKHSTNHLKYYEKCRIAAGSSDQIEFIDHLEHQELAKIYKAAKVHVLPSWFETTGLSSLEAGVMGCNLVITKNGDTEEYFGDMVYYCKPQDIDSIKGAIIAAHVAPQNSKLSHFIECNYNWSITAKQTFEAYKNVLD
jgi:glycosyltransferase involved in cell wall biosynthesis